MIIQTEALCKSFGRVRVLDNLNLQVPEGSVFALVGTNGAGKTTIMRTLVNILQASSGVSTLLGKDSRKLTPSDFRRIGYVSENQELPERLTIAQYFDYLRPLYPGWDVGLEQSMRREMDLPAKRQLSKLSHGMRMKTVLIAGLAFRPRLLILDEPLSGMDTLTRDEVIDGLLEQAGETTILISSHELSEIENFTSHIAFMDKGILSFQESIESLHNRFREVYVTLSEKKTLPVQIPKSWIAPQIEGHLLRFVASAFQEQETLQQELMRHFGAVQVEAEPMNLREISKVLIRDARQNRRELAA